MLFLPKALVCASLRRLSKNYVWDEKCEGTWVPLLILEVTKGQHSLYVVCSPWPTRGSLPITLFAVVPWRIPLYTVSPLIGHWSVCYSKSTIHELTPPGNGNGNKPGEKSAHPTGSSMVVSLLF